MGHKNGVPYFTLADLAADLGISYGTARSRLINVRTNADFVEPWSSVRWNWIDEGDNRIIMTRLLLNR